MSAKEYGARLLAGVHKESLEELLAQLRRKVQPFPRNVLGVPQLDEVLESIRYPVMPVETETWSTPDALVSDGPSWHYDADGVRSNVSPPLARSAGVGAKPATIEITSPHLFPGKTTLLYYLAAVTALPRQHGGKEAAVVFFDNDGRFSSERLYQITRHHICHSRARSLAMAGEEAEEEEQEGEEKARSVAKQALDHVHVLRPASSAQLHSMLVTLPGSLLSAAHPSSDRALGLIIIDSATAFYWADRFSSEMARLEHPEPAHWAAASLTVQIINTLKVLQSRFDCTVAFSTASYSSLPRRPRPPPSGSYAPGQQRAVSPWTRYATMRLILFPERLVVPKFAPQLDLEVCLQDRDRRATAMKQAGIQVRAGEAGEKEGYGDGSSERVACRMMIGEGVEIE